MTSDYAFRAPSRQGAPVETTSPAVALLECEALDREPVGWPRTQSAPDAVSPRQLPPPTHPELKAARRRRAHRFQLLELDPHCHYCRCQLTQFNSTLDHLAPKSRRGGNLPTNLVLCCPTCNNAKGDKTPQEWLSCVLEEIDALSNVARNLQHTLDDRGDQIPETSRNRLPGQLKRPEINGRHYNFTEGVRVYSLVDTMTGETVLRNLSLDAAVHFLTEVPPDRPLTLHLHMTLFQQKLGLMGRAAFLRLKSQLAAENEIRPKEEPRAA